MNLSGSVGIYGDQFSELGIYYAKVTGRNYYVANSIDDLIKISDLSIVIIPWKEISSHLLHSLYECDQKKSIGIIPFTNSANLEAFISRIIHELSNEKKVVNSSHISSFADISSFKLGNNSLVIGGKADTSTLKTSISSNFEILTLLGHSDGLDIGIGSSVICPINSDLKNFEKLSCVYNNWCYRLNDNVSNIRNNRYFISINDVKANVLISLCCFSLILSESKLDPNTSFLAQLVQNGQIGSAIVAWGIGFFKPNEIEELQHMVSHGLSLGETINKYKYEPVMKNKRIRLAIIGDPEVCFAPTKDMNRYENIYTKNKVSRVSKNISFKKQFASNLYKKIVSDKISNLKLDKTDFILNQDLKLEENRLKFLDLLTCIGTTPSKIWIDKNISFSTIFDKNMHCCYCNAITVTYKSNEFVEEDERIIVSCPACGIIKDYTSSLTCSQFKIINNDTVKLISDRPNKIVNCILVVENIKNKPLKKYKLSSIGEFIYKTNKKISFNYGINTIAFISVEPEGYSISRQVHWEQLADNRLKSAN